MTDHSHRGWLTAGRALITVVAVFPSVGAFAADWNATHVFNPKWPPHAKFHNAQTISLAVEATALSLWQLWKPGPLDRDRLRWATLLASLFFLTQLPAVAFPGAAVTDDDNPVQPFDFHGIPVNQVTGSVALVLPLLAGGYAITKRGLDPTNA